MRKDKLIAPLGMGQHLCTLVQQAKNLHCENLKQSTNMKLITLNTYMCFSIHPFLLVETVLVPSNLFMPINL